MSDPTKNAQAASALEAQITTRAWKDQAFKQQLLHNPKATLEREFGISLPAGVEYKILEETAHTAYFVLPMPPEQASPDELAEEELEAVAGGVASNTNVMSGCNCCSSPCVPLPPRRTAYCTL